MTAVSAYARARAAATGVAQPIASVRHLHLVERPLVFIPLGMAGEANAPLAAMVGSDPDHPTLLVVPQPRNRDLRFAFAAQLAAILLPYVNQFAPPRPEPAETGEAAEADDKTDSKTGGEGKGAEGRAGADVPVAADAPQLLVPNRTGIEFVRLLGRSTRFRRTEGEYAVPPSVPLLGQWLTFFADQAEHPGSCLLLAATEALALHWATGQSALEDAHLASLMAWIEPPPGLTAPEAARQAEDPLLWPPAGPATDPGFDNEVLAPAIRAYDASEPGSAARRRAVAALEHALRGQLEPTWNLMWRAVARLRKLPPGASVEGRWAEDRRRFSGFHAYVEDGGPPKARRDGAVAAARRLTWLERAQTEYESSRAFDDPLVMANYRVTGEAFVGTVVEVDRERRVANSRGNLVTRPLVTLRTEDPALLADGTKVVATTRRKQEGVVRSIERLPGQTLVTLELSGGMGRSKVPPPGTVPEPGEVLCYCSVLAENIPSPRLPGVEETPWTHGGPPESYTPNDDDAGEVWE